MEQILIYTAEELHSGQLQQKYFLPSFEFGGSTPPSSTIKKIKNFLKKYLTIQKKVVFLQKI